MYLLTNNIKSVLWGWAVRLSYIEDAWCLKVKEEYSYKSTHHLGLRGLLYGEIYVEEIFMKLNVWFSWKSTVY